MTTVEHEPEISIRYEGPGVATEIWGSTQANFLVARRPHPAKEVAVLLNDNAAQWLARELGMEETPEFKESAARVAGRIAIERSFERYRHLDSVLMLSMSQLESDPEILMALKRRLVAPSGAAPVPDRLAPQH